MQGKITLISPPDFYENSNRSLLFAHIDDSEQDTISKWFGRIPEIPDLNIYVYSGEPNVAWFLYALNRCDYKYINLDGVNSISTWLSGYALSRPNVFYKSSDPNTVAIFNHINQHHVDDVEIFMERWLSDQGQIGTTGM